MNLIEALYFTKKHFEFNNEQLANYLGISKQELAKIFAGHKGINGLTLKRISQILRISMDELTDNKFILPFYHFSKHVYSLYMRAEKDYPEYSIQKNDNLYIRPFVEGEDKVGQLVLVYDAKTQKNSVEKYDGNLDKLMSQGKIVYYHIVGKSTILYQPFEDVEFQRKLTQVNTTEKRRRGRPIKT